MKRSSIVFSEEIERLGYNTLMCLCREYSNNSFVAYVDGDMKKHTLYKNTADKIENILKQIKRGI